MTTPPKKRKYLTQQQVQEIRHKVADGLSQVKVAEEYEIVSSHVSAIVRGHIHPKAGGPILQEDGSFKTDVEATPSIPATVKEAEKIEAQFRAQVSLNPERFVPKEVKTNESRRDIAYFLRVLVQNRNGLYENLRGKTLDEVVTLLNQRHAEELAKAAGMSMEGYLLSIKPFPKRHQGLLEKFVSRSYGLVLVGPQRNRVFKTVEEIAAEQVAKKQVAKKQVAEKQVAEKKESTPELDLDRDRVLNQTQAQLKSIMGRLDFIDPTPQLEVVQKQLTDMDASNDGQLGRIAAKLEQIETTVEKNFQSINNEIAHMVRSISTIAGETKGMTKELEKCTNFITATRNRLLEEKRQALQPAVSDVSDTKPTQP